MVTRKLPEKPVGGSPHNNPFTKGKDLASHFKTSKKLQKGMAELNSFGFKTSATQADLSLLLLFRSHCPLNLGFHVSDLWSQRQQQEFLKTMKLERAQLAREREASFINFLVATKKKPSGALSSTEIRPETDRGALDKYLSQTPKSLSKLAHSEPTLPPIKPAPHSLDDLISHCDSTLARYKGQRKTIQTPHQPSRAQDDVLRDSIKSLRLGGKRFANPLRK